MVNYGVAQGSVVMVMVQSSIVLIGCYEDRTINPAFFLGKENKPTFFSKGCGGKFKNKQESFIRSFYEKLAETSPFQNSARTLKKPFTDEAAKANVRTDMLNCKAIGSEMVVAYVLPRYCRERHNVSDEKQRMKRKRLEMFAGDVKRKRKKQNVDKEQKDMLELLAAGVTRMNVDEDAVEAMKGIAGTTTSRYPQLLCK